MIYNAMEIANFIIDMCYHEKKPVSNLQLQKILFFAWVDYYKETGRALFGDPIRAWQFGPVVPEVYYEYCAYGGRPINIRCEVDIIEEVKSKVYSIVMRYIDVPVSILVERTHRKNSAWDRIYQGGSGNRKVIPFNLIKEVECGGA